MQPDIAVVGGGLLGRCLAWRASKAGARVVLYDAASSRGEGSAAWVAAGMIAPTAEAIDADAQIAAIGRNSLALWPKWIAELPTPVFYRENGTLLLWHRQDAEEALRVERLLASRQAPTHVQPVENAQVGELEPALQARFPQALYLPGEAQVDNRELLNAVAIALEDEGGTGKQSLPKTRFPGSKRLWIAVAWAPRASGLSSEAFAEKLYAFMLPNWNCVTCCGCCIPAIPYTSFLARKDESSSGQPASRATIAHLLPSAEFSSF